MKDLNKGQSVVNTLLNKGIVRGEVFNLYRALGGEVIFLVNEK